METASAASQKKKVCERQAVVASEQRALFSRERITCADGERLTSVADLAREKTAAPAASG